MASDKLINISLIDVGLREVPEQVDIVIAINSNVSGNLLHYSYVSPKLDTVLFVRYQHEQLTFFPGAYLRSLWVIREPKECLFT